MDRLPFDIAHLLYKHKAGLPMQEDEVKMLHDWIGESPQHEALFREAVSSGSYTGFSEQIEHIDVNKAWNTLRRKKHSVIL